MAGLDPRAGARRLLLPTARHGRPGNPLSGQRRRRRRSGGAAGGPLRHRAGLLRSQVPLSQKTRTFCTNSRCAHVVQEKYVADDGRVWYSANGHAYSASRPANGLANFALLKTVTLTQPLASGQDYASMLGVQASLIGGGHPIMQRVGDFRLGKRSTREGFSGDLYDFEPTLPSACPGDLGLSVPAKILRSVWNALKLLDTIVPGVLHPSTILYYPEIKLYANRPVFQNDSFLAAPGIRLDRRRGGHQPGHHRRLGLRDSRRGRHTGRRIARLEP